MVDYPDVPNVLGVPRLNFLPNAASALQMMTSDGALADYAPKQWGLFLGGAPAIIADSVFSVEYRNESSISDYPLERGSFESYNKVASPFDVRLRFMAGTQQQRAALIEKISTIAGDLKLYDAVMPEKTFSNVNVIHFDFKRTAASGYGLLAVDVWVREVRQITSSAGMQSAAPSGAAQVFGGTKQPLAPTAWQTSVAQNLGGSYLSSWVVR